MQRFPLREEIDKVLPPQDCRILRQGRRLLGVQDHRGHDHKTKHLSYHISFIIESS